jgi:hypothetical protein
VGSGIGGLLDGLGKALNQAPGQAPKAESVVKTRTVTTAKQKETIKQPAAAPPCYEDATGIEKGMSCEDVTRRFGPTAMAFATENDAKTMSYASKTGGVQVECQDGKVASVEKPH